MNDLEVLRDYCLSKPGVTEDFPFDEDTLAFRVMEKIFALTNLENFPPRVNLKCDPEKAIELRAEYQSIAPGYHMNKRHWNTVTLDGELNSELVAELIDHSYELVVAGLTRAKRDALSELS